MTIIIPLLLLLQQQPIPYKFLPPLDPKFKADYSVMGSSPGVPSNLGSLVKNSDIIVLGRFDGIIQHRHSPKNSNAPEQSTIYQFTTEMYLIDLSLNL